MRSPKRVMAATMLILEGLALSFAGLVAMKTSDLGVAGSLALFGALSVLCLLASGTLRTRAGYPIGTALQVVLFATGLIVTDMFLIGAVFAGLWFTSLYWGERIERERGIVAAGLAAREADGEQESAVREPGERSADPR